MKSNIIKTIVIPAAGAGTRLLPLTSVMPKEMLRVVDQPAIYYVIKEAYRSGIRNIIIVVNPWKKSIEKYFSDKSGKSLLPEFLEARFFFIKTNDMFGDGHALYLTRNMIHEDFFAVSMADLLCLSNKPFLKQLIGAHRRTEKPVISVERVPKDHVNRYGIITPGLFHNDVYEVKDIIEKPSIRKAPSNLAMTGKYIISKTIFPYLWTLLRGRHLSEEIRLADALKEYVKTNALCALACAGNHFDVGNKAALLKTEFVFALQDKNFGKEFKHFVRRLKK